MYISHERLTKSTRPTILVVYPHKEVSDIIRDELIDLGCTVIIARTPSAALAGLSYYPDIAILDVVMPQIDFGFERRRLKRYVQEGLLCPDDYWIGIDQLRNAVSAEELRRDGIMLAEEIQDQIPNIPVIFIHTDPTLLHTLPFGESFCLGNEKSCLSDLVEQIAVECTLARQIEPDEPALVVELPQIVGAYAMRDTA
jgi:CheY-like chemotaxis protein